MTHLLTFATFGSHLHGDERGSVDRNHNVPGTRLIAPNERFNRYESEQLSHQRYLIPPEHAPVILQAIRDISAKRRWTLIAAHVRTNHIHAIIDSPQSPERTMTACKAEATKLLTQQNMVAPGSRIWARHGSTVSLRSTDAVRRAAVYVLEAQGTPIACFDSGILDRRILPSQTHP